MYGRKQQKTEMEGGKEYGTMRKLLGGWGGSSKETFMEKAVLKV